MNMGEVKMKCIIFCMCSIFILGSLSYSQDYWEQMNGPFGGTVEAIATDTTNGFIYASIENNGVHRSVDNGNSWQPTNNILDTISVYALAVDTSGNVFAGTNRGAYRSADHGDTWVQINEGLIRHIPGTGIYYPFQLTKLCTAPNGYIFASAQSYIFRSEDNGENWETINYYYSPISAFTVNSNGHIFVAADSLYYSQDSGDHWMSIQVDSADSRFYINDIAINSDDQIFISCSRIDSSIYRSLDNGSSWSKIADIGGSLLIDANDYIYVATFSYSDNGSWIYRSTDNGDHWTQIWKFNPTVKNLANIPNGSLFAGTFQAGVYRSNDSGINWEQTSTGLPFTTINSLAVNSNGVVFAGLLYNNIVQYQGTTHTWITKNSGIEGNIVNAIAFNPNGDIFAATESGVFCSTNKGDSWTACNNGLPAGIDTFYIHSLAINSNGTIFAVASDYVTNTSDSLYRSTDNGENWTEASSGFPDIKEITCISFDSSGNIYAGTAYDDIYRSVDDGENWTKITTGLSSYYITGICIYGTGTIFITSTGDANGVFRSTDNGENWTVVNNGLSFFNEKYLIINKGGDLFFGSKYGIYQSADKGDHWMQINSGLQHTDIRCLAIDKNDYLFAGTLYGGVYRSINPSTASEQNNDILPFSFKLEQNYPNPFNPVTVISYRLAENSHVNLSIYNILGQKVETLLSEKQNSGKHSIEWDASGFSSGIYFYRIQAGDFIQTKRMLLIK